MQIAPPTSPPEALMDLPAFIHCRGRRRRRLRHDGRPRVLVALSGRPFHLGAANKIPTATL